MHNTIPSLTPAQTSRFHGSYVCDGDCWEWRHLRGPKGYGKFNLGSSSYRAHRVAYFLATGDQPNDKFVCHSCDNPCCVNPAHLWLGTPRDNMRDMIAKGRKRRGPNKKPRGPRIANTGAWVYPEYCARCGHRRIDDYVETDGRKRCRPCNVHRTAIRRQRRRAERLARQSTVS